MSGEWEQFRRHGQGVWLRIDMVHLVGGKHRAAIVLCQLDYWSGRSSHVVERDGHLWLVQTYREWWEQTALNERTMRRALGDLEALGFIETRTWKYGGERALHIRLVENALDEAVGALLDSDILSGTKVPAKPAVSEPDVSSGSSFLQRGNENKNTSREVESVVVADDAAFLTWYVRYPKKVGKPAAARAWKAAVKRASVEEIEEGFVRHLPGLVDAHSRGYCPNPATWLNQDRWDDEPPTMGKSRTSALDVLDQFGDGAR